MNCYFYTFGCKVNTCETAGMQSLLQSAGYTVVSQPEEADIFLFNSCTVTASGDSRLRHAMRKVRREHPDALLVLTGCYPQAYPDEAAAIPEADLVLGTKHRSRLPGLLAELCQNHARIAAVDSYGAQDDFEALPCDTMPDNTRAFLKIQDGCNCFCSYCIIPYARGPIRSREPQEVVAEVKRLAENGFKEVVLTGIHVASYGKDRRDTSLLDILKQVHEVEGIERIRFSSIEPNVVTEEFAQTMAALPKVCDHFHLSLQSGCDKTLKEMNRKYDTEKYRQAAATLRKYLPKVALTTDIIVGFPGETEEDFRESYAFAEEIGFAKIHVFPYSPKRGTPAAARKDQLLNAVKSERSHTLIQLSDRMAADFLADAVGTDAEVLYERAVGEGIYEGHTTNYMKVHGRSEADLTNRIAKTHITRAEGEMLFGDVEA